MSEAKKAYIVLTLLPEGRLLDATTAATILAFLGYAVSEEEIRRWNERSAAQPQTVQDLRTFVRSQFEQAPAASAERDAWFSLLRDFSTLSDSSLDLYRSELMKKIRQSLEELVVWVSVLRKML